MAISLDEFWTLAVKAGLIASTEQQDLVQAFDRVRGDKPADPKSLSHWLIERGLLSRYQAKMLLAGRSGPFHFGDYRVYDRVESGRLAGLFRAGHLHNGQPALLFFFTKAMTHDAALWRQIQGQAKQAIEVKHPHVSRLDELVSADGYKFAALESLDGVSLADYLRKKPLPLNHVLRYARRAAAGLGRLHKLGQAHGDVRPENILIDNTGQLKLLYFPLARELDAALAPNARNADFLAPELWSSNPLTATPRGDIYSLGCTIYMLLTGRAPFGGETLADKARRHADELAPPLDPALKAPSGLAKLLGMMLAKDPEARPRSMTKIAEALGSLAGKGEPENGAADHDAATPVNIAAGKPAKSNDRSRPNVEAKATPIASVAVAPGAVVAGAVAPAAVPVAAVAPTGAVVVTGRAPMAAVAVAGAPPTPAGVAVAGVYPPQAVAAAMPTGVARPGGIAVATAVPTSIAAGYPAQGAPFVVAGVPVQSAPPTAVAVPVSAAAPMPMGAAAPVAPAGGISAEVLESFAPDPLAERSERREPREKRGARGKGVNPTYVAVGVTTAALLVGGIVAWFMANRAAPTALKDTNEFARVEAEMRKLEEGAAKTHVDKPKPENDKPSDEEDPAAETEAKPSKSAESKSALVKDDGRTLWVSPTSGPSLDLHYVPPGTQVVFALRPADLLRNAEGEKVLAALGPAGAAARHELEQMVGVPMTEIEQLFVAFFSLEKGAPQMAAVARLEKPKTPKELLAIWKNPKKAGENYYKGSQWAYYVPAAGENKVFSVAPLKEMSEAGDMADDVPPLGKAMEKLLRQTDASRTFTLLFAPNYFESAGRPLASGAMGPLIKMADRFLGEGVGAAALSLNWGDDFFAELRVYSTDEAPDEMAKRLKDQIGGFSDEVENFLVALSPGRYSARLLNRFPQMLRTASDYTRVDAEENQALVRCFLPITAGHNLLMGSELAISQVGGGGGGGAAMVAAAPKKAAGPADALNQKITLQFSRDTLEKTIEMISKEIDTEMVIIGGDLQLEGITKNQSFGLDEKDRSAREILQTVMLKANPDGKLVYIFKPKNPGEKDIIFVTTRAAVAKRGDKLPPELAKDAPAKPKK